VGLSSVELWSAQLEKVGGFNSGTQSAERKLAATMLAMLTASKLKMLPVSKFPGCPKMPDGICFEASECYGRLKTLAMAGEGPKLRQALTDCGGTDKGLTDAELVQIWGANEHHNLHCCLFGNADIYNAVHMTSLNNTSMSTGETWEGRLTPGGGDKSLKKYGPLGGYNDKGNYAQWGWATSAAGFFDFIGIDTQ
jgi:hypothetical protein